MMDTTISMLHDAVSRALADSVTVAGTLAAETKGMDMDTWRALCHLGLDEAGIPLDQHLAVLRAIGQAAALVPYAESQAIGGWLSREVELDDTVVQTVAILSPAQFTLNADGSLRICTAGMAVPWGRVVERVLFSFEFDRQAFVAIVPASTISWGFGKNMASEPLDAVLTPAIDVGKENVRAVAADFGPDAIRLRGALCRSAQMTGVMGRVMDIALRYTQDRKQFRKSLSQFQIIQSYLAEMAGEHCAAQAALAGAEQAYGEPGASSTIAIAKIRTGQAARSLTSLSHQVHGAIGFTQEYPLHNWTRRLWAWREEYGNEAYWAKRLGQMIAGVGADRFWPSCTENGWER